MPLLSESQPYEERVRIVLDLLSGKSKPEQQKMLQDMLAEALTVGDQFLASFLQSQGATAPPGTPGAAPPAGSPLRRRLIQIAAGLIIVAITAAATQVGPWLVAKVPSLFKHHAPDPPPVTTPTTPTLPSLLQQLQTFHTSHVNANKVVALSDDELKQLSESGPGVKETLRALHEASKGDETTRKASSPATVTGAAAAAAPVTPPPGTAVPKNPPK